MLSNRLIACLDVVGEKVTKALNFQDNIEVGGAADVMRALYLDGIDEIVLYDIKASVENRPVSAVLLNQLANMIFIPFTVGGGISTVSDMYDVLSAGAEKISIDSAAVKNPKLISAGAAEFGSQCIVVSTQVKKMPDNGIYPSGYAVMTNGARHLTKMDALEWSRRAYELGAGELVINSIDRDGTETGFELEITRKISNAVNVPVIASGGAGKLEDVREVFLNTGATGAILSSMLYSPRLERNYSVSELKAYLVREGISVRPHTPGYLGERLDGS